MPTTLFADQLQGPAWDRVRAIRKKLFGDSGQPLDPEVVPEVFHHLMPYASLLTTGEDAALEDFFDALDAPTRNALMSAIEPLVEQLRAYGLDGLEGLQRQERMPRESPERHTPSAQQWQWSEALFRQTLRESAPLTREGSSPPEQEVMLDLARFYDLNEER